MNPQYRCFYTGIVLRKQLPDTVRDNRVPDWQVYSKEHLISQASVVFEHISKAHDGEYRALNSVPCSRMVNTNINSYHLYMKVRFRQIHRELYPHFHEQKPYQPSYQEFLAAFNDVNRRVVKEFDHDTRMPCIKRFLNSPLIIAWDMITAKNFFPEIKIRKINPKLLVSEIN